MDPLDLPDLDQKRAERNWKSASAGALVALAFSLLLELKWLFFPSQFGASPAGAWYGLAYPAMALGALAALGLLRWTRFPWVPAAFVVQVVGFGVVLSWIDLHYSPEYTAYMICAFAAGVIYSADGRFYAFLLASGSVSLALLVAATLPGRPQLPEVLTHVLLVGLAFTGCLVLEAQRREADRLSLRLEDANRQLQEASLRDALTGLYNRRFLNEFLAGKRALSVRMAIPLSVVLIDLDHFKEVNDKLGHLAGDAVLRDFGRVLLDGLRESDLAARYGGEEFLLVLPQARAEAAAAVTERILATVRKTTFPGVPWPVTFSAGAAELGPGESAEALVARADRLLYQAKETRNRVLWTEGPG